MTEPAGGVGRTDLTQSREEDHGNVPHAPRPTGRLTVAALALCALLAAATASGASPGAPAAPGDARSERERVRQERAEAAVELDYLEATNAEVEAALDALNANVAGREAALADAQRAVAAAEAALAEARAREAAAEAEIAAMDERLRRVAVDAYISHGNLDDATAVLRTADIGEAMQRRSLVDLRAGQFQEVLAELHTLSENLAVARADAEAATQAASEHRAEVDRQLAEVTAARDQQTSVAAEVEARIEAALAEAAGLEALDAELSRQIAAEQAAIAARNREAAARAAASRSTGRVTRVSGDISLTTVRGITVASEIADELEALLAAAEADGITFGGGGYRSSDSQVALREAHCGSSDYAVYEMPSSQCSPPTARPGQSMHERGLAVDFTYNGRVISSRSNPGYQWLASHASSYGFYNLPSEPWHWSTNGQ